jgi:hypothetical protein
MQIIRRGVVNGAYTIYQPGGTSGPRTRTVLADALALARDIGAASVLIDTMVGGQPEFATDTAYDFTNIALGLGFWDDLANAYEIFVRDGATITGLERVFGGLYITNLSSSSVMTIANAKYPDFTIEGNSVIRTGVGGAPFFSVGAGGYLTLSVNDGQLDGDGKGAVLTAAATGTADIRLFDYAYIANNTLTGAGTITVTRGAVIEGTTMYYGTVGHTQTGASAFTYYPL